MTGPGPDVFSLALGWQGNDRPWGGLCMLVASGIEGVLKWADGSMEYCGLQIDDRRNKSERIIIIIIIT